MLEGSIAYNDGGTLRRYTAQAVDSETFKMYLSSGSYDNLEFLCLSDDVLMERVVEVKTSKVNVETVLKNIDGKTVKAPVNADFFCRFGALIQYVKTHCNSRTEDGYTGVALASGEFDVKPEKSYTLENGSMSAKVRMMYGVITDLVVDAPWFKIQLHESGAVRIFRPLKNAWSSGFKMGYDYLGFKVDVGAPNLVSHTDGMYHTLEEVMQAHPEKELAWLRGKDYRIVTDETLEEVCEYIYNFDGYVYYDTETTGLDITFRSRTGDADQLVGVILSVKYGESFFFPLQMKRIKNLCGGDHHYVMERYLRRILEGKELVAQNMSFDWKVGYIYEINCNIVHDTMALLSVTLAEEIKDYKVGLKENAKLLLGRDSLELSDLVIDNSWGESDIKFWDLPEELVRLYACADTDNTMGVLQYAIQNDLLGRYNARKVYEIEVAFSYAVGYQEFYGHRIDINQLDTVRAEISVGQEEEMRKMVEICGHEFNPNSPKQLVEILYTELGIPEQISRSTNRVTTNKEALNKLAELTDAEDNAMYPFVRHLLKYREYEGVRKIIDKFPETATNDGYVFSRVMQYGTTTGRVSINNPNYQSYNDPVKRNVIPRPGFWMFDTDYSSVEYRVLGNMVGNKRIMKSFEDPDFDYHTYQAAHMYGIPYANVTKKLRKAAKGINFGIPYGMGDESLGVRIFGEASAENTRKAADLRTAYFKGQEDIRDWFEMVRDGGVRNGYTETYFGRRRYYRRAEFSESAIRRQAGNAVVQGTAADIYKLAVGRVFRRICREGWLGKVLLSGFIHDELLGEVSNEINPGVFLKALREEFEVRVFDADGSPWCPLYMGFGFGMSWYEAKSVELPIKLQWELVDEYGDDGFPDWDGRGREFFDKTQDMLRDFEIRDIRSQILDPDSQGKEIKSALNTQILDCVETDSKLYGLVVSSCSTEEEMLRRLGVEAHIQCLMRDSNGEIIKEFSPSKSTQEAITQYCQLHGVDRSKVSLLDIAEVEAGNISVVSSYDFSDDETESESSEKRQRIKDARVDTFGMFVDEDAMEVTLLFAPVEYMNMIRQRVNKEGVGLRVVFKDSLGIKDPNQKGKLYVTRSYLDTSEINFIQELYIQLLR